MKNSTYEPGIANDTTEDLFYDGGQLEYPFESTNLSQPFLFWLCVLDSQKSPLPEEARKVNENAHKRIFKLPATRDD